VFALVEIFSEL